jgi:predicted transposase YbfD/YdcC
MMLGKIARMKKRVRKTSNPYRWLDVTPRLNTIRTKWSQERMAHPQSWVQVREATARVHYMVSVSLLL